MQKMDIKSFFTDKHKQKIWLFTLFSAVIFFFVYLGYVGQVRKIDPQIFDFDETIEWNKSGGEIFQQKSYWDLNNYLPTKDVYQNFDLSLSIRDLVIGGVVFKRVDQNNFYMLLYDVPNSALAVFDIRDGKANPVIRRGIIHENPIQIRLVVEDTTGQLFVNQMSLGDFSLDDRPGRFGLLLKGEDGEKVRFSDIHVKGTLANGKSIDATMDRPSVRKGGVFLWQFLFLSFLIVGGFVLSKIYSGFLDGTEFSSFGANTLHFIIAVFLFAPFIFGGHVYVASGDNYSQILPLLFYSKQVFLDIVTGKSLGLWNPYVHNGMPFFSNHWQMIFTPLNWPVFLFPDKYMLWALSLRHFLELFLTGVFAYKFFAIELDNKRWALYCSVVFQLCSVMLFAYTVFPASSLYMLMILFLYLLWSSDQRKGILNYVYLTLVIYMILTSANFAFIFYAGLSLIVLSLYWILRREKTQQLRAVCLLFMSGLTGVLTAMVRLLPCAIGIKESNRLSSQLLLASADRLPLLSRLFVPDIVGGGGFFKAFVASFGRTFGSNVHSQIIFFVYFGVIAAALLLIGLFLKNENNNRMSFWKGYVALTFGYVLFVEPVNAAISAVLFPFNHYTYNIILLPIGVCSLIGFVGIKVERMEYSPRYLLTRIVPILALVTVYILIIIAQSYKPMLENVRLGVFILLACWILYLILNLYNKGQNVFVELIVNAAEVLLWVGLFFFSVTALLQPAVYKQYVFDRVHLPAVFILFLILAGVKARYYQDRFKKLCMIQIALVLVATFVVCGLMISKILANFLLLSIESASYYSYMGILVLKMLVTVFIVGYAFRLISLKRMGAPAFVALIVLVTVIDLVSFNLSSRDVAAPSIRGETFKDTAYPYQGLKDRLVGQMDQLNYRTHYLHRADITTNENIALHIPSYSGVVGYMSERFGQFIGAFGYSSNAIAIFPEDATNNQRFLDLSAVRYEIFNDTVLRERPSALSRMSLIYDYDVVENDEQVLDTLVKKSFDPQYKVLLSEIPEISKTMKPGRPSQFVEFRQKNNDELHATVSTDQPAVLVFNDSYHKGWKAYVDKKEVNVIAANYNAMGVFLKAGDHQVVFKFRPAEFYQSLYISLLGMCLFVVSIFVFRKKDVFYGSNHH